MLNYTDIGKGIPIVFIHGLGSTKEAWMPQYKLASKYRLIMPDLRGHGETVLNEDITVKNFASDIVNLLEYLGVESAYICGLSLGGIVAQEFYKQRPDMAKGLILSNTTSYIPSFFANSVEKATIKLLESGELLDVVLSRSLHNQDYKKEAERTFNIRDTYLESSKSALGLNYFPTLITIDKPVLLIGGTHDKVTPFINMLTMKCFIRNVKSVIFENTGHLSNIEQSEKFNSCIDEFIKGGISNERIR